jgi:hypothetical protein
MVQLVFSAVRLRLGLHVFALTDHPTPDHHVSARMSKYFYGIEFLRDYDPKDKDHVGRKHRLCELPSGPKLLRDAFDCILPRVSPEAFSHLAWPHDVLVCCRTSRSKSPQCSPASIARSSSPCPCSATSRSSCGAIGGDLAPSRHGSIVMQVTQSHHFFQDVIMTVRIRGFFHTVHSSSGPVSTEGERRGEARSRQKDVLESGVQHRDPFRAHRVQSSFKVAGRCQCSFPLFPVSTDSDVPLSPQGKTR